MSAIPTRVRLAAPPARTGLAHQLRVLRVIASLEFKLKYADSALGYVWSLIKPLSLFAVLYVVFGEFFKLRGTFELYPVYLLIGIVLWFFFADATTMSLTSIVARGDILRKLSFPRIVIPVSVTVTAAITFAVNLLAIAAFVAWNRLVPQPDWLLLVPLLLELYVFTLGLSLVLATLFVRFRDVGQLWELAVQLLFYATPIIYPVGLLPPWARSVALLNPFSQVMQDVRDLVLYRADERAVFTAADVLAGAGGRLLPIAIALGTFVVGVWLFRREESWFAERV